MTTMVVNKYILMTYLFFITHSVSSQKMYQSIDQLMSDVKGISSTLEQNELKIAQSKLQKIAAIYGILDLNAAINFTVTDNTRLPVSVFPAEIFGGPPGTYKEIQTGIQWNSNANFYADIKILNLAGWFNFKSNSTQTETIKNDAILSYKTFYESVAIIYYNILNIQAQQENNKLAISIADTIYQNTYRKFQQNIVRQQDVNNAQITLLNARENSTSLENSLRQQYLTLYTLCDITDSIVIAEKVSNEINIVLPEVQKNELNEKSILLKLNTQKHSRNQSYFNFAPTISFFAAQNFNQFSTDFRTFDPNYSWINSSYIGFKATLNLPNANTLNNAFKLKYDVNITQKSYEHSVLDTENNRKKLTLELAKMHSQYETNKEILKLNEDTYSKNMKLYQLGVISLDTLLLSYQQYINSKYNSTNATINLQYTLKKVELNNTIK